MFEELARDFCVPGVPRPAAPAEPPVELFALRSAVDRVLGLDVTGLPAGVALEHARAVLVEVQRLQAATLAAVAELEARELYALDGAGSTRSWLAQQPAGRTGLAGEASRLARRPLLRAALSAGVVSAATVDLVAAALERVPAEVPEDQLLGVLRYGLPALLADRGVELVVLDGVVEEALAAVGLDPAQRLEPACVLLARYLPPTTLGCELRMLFDALLPEQLAEQTRAAWLEQRVHVTKRHGLGYDFRIRVDDTLGPLVEGALLARMPTDDASALAVLSALADGTDLITSVEAGRAARRAADAAASASSDGSSDGSSDASSDASADGVADAEAASRPRVDVAAGGAAGEAGADAETDGGTGVAVAAGEAGDAQDKFGTAGPGLRMQLAPAWTDPPVEGTPGLTREQKLVVALAALLADLSAVAPGSGCPQPVQLTVVASLDAVQGRPGVIPGQLDTRHGPVPLSTEALQRLGCGATLTAALLDAAGTPVGASGEHRHATRRERRALRARWGSRCAVNGCTRQGTVPHHVEPWWKVHRTRLTDLAPLCDHHHHDVHDGHRTLRLRDGRLINDQGWADQLPLAV